MVEVVLYGGPLDGAKVPLLERHLRTGYAMVMAARSGMGVVPENAARTADCSAYMAIKLLYRRNSQTSRWEFSTASELPPASQKEP